MSSTAPYVLLVNDDPQVRDSLAGLLRQRGIRVEAAEDAESALRALSENGFDAVLSDTEMPGSNGSRLLAQMRERSPDIPVLATSGLATVDSAVEALQAGAFDYLTEPLQGEQVVNALERAFRTRGRPATEEGSSGGTGAPDLIGTSPAIQKVHELIRKLASRNSHVLITGECGTGKEIVARKIHRSGSRANGPFVTINCAAIAEDTLERELFGPLNGAPNRDGAPEQGLFATASGGSVFLDEVCEMPLSIQSKLVHLLQDRVTEPEGTDPGSKLDIRILAATSRKLELEVRAGRFRADLFYRLNVIPIYLPPLRERREDILVLAQDFLWRHGGPRAPQLSPAAIDRLMRLPWLGNARELENTIERAMVLCEGNVIEARHLQVEVNAPAQGSPVDQWLSEALRQRMSVRELRDRYIDRVLSATDGCKSRASKILGVDPRTLSRWERRRPPSVQRASEPLHNERVPAATDATRASAG